MAEGKRRPQVALRAEQAEAFLAELGRSGNAARAVRTAGATLGGVYGRRARDPAFAARWTAALAAAADGLGRELPDRTEARLGRGGRLQLIAPRAREWSAGTERDFLDALSATANVRAAAQAVGSTAVSAWRRRRQRPAFAEAWDEAVDDGHARLEMLLMERGAALLGGVGWDGHGPDAAADAQAQGAFDPHIAMWLLKRRDMARAGTPQKRGGWRRREVPIEEVRAEVLRKVAAIERAEARGLRAGGLGERAPLVSTPDEREGAA